MSASQVSALKSLAGPVVGSYGCDLEDVVVRRAGSRRLVRVVVDHGGGELTLDVVASISRDISRRLDDSNLLGQSAYVLEVSSPGVDRPLRLPRHWARAVGRIVRVTPRSGDPFEGRVLRADDAAVVLDIDGAPVTVRLDDVARAIVQVEFSRLDEASSDDPQSDDPQSDGAGSDDAGSDDPGQDDPGQDRTDVVGEV